MTLSCHIDFDGRCEEAFRFYAAHLGGRIRTLLRVGDSPLRGRSGLPDTAVVHANIRFGDMELAGADVAPPAYARPRGVYLLLGLESEARVRACFDALQEGGEVVLPPQATFWSPCYAIVVDRFGVPWKLNCGT